jgi:hypothetical protein
MLFSGFAYFESLKLPGTLSAIGDLLLSTATAILDIRGGQVTTHWAGAFMLGKSRDNNLVSRSRMRTFAKETV